MRKLENGTRLVVGKNSVKELVKWKKESIIEVLTVKPRESLDFDTRNLKVSHIDKDSLSKLSNSDNHQGVGAIVFDNQNISLKSQIKRLEDRENCTILIMAEVQDPHHLGAAFRACEVFGVDLLIFPNSHSSGISPVVSKVAVGATELVNYCQVANINEAIRKLKEAGFWITAADPCTEKSKPLSNFDFSQKSAIVFGAEGHGLPKLTLELSDFRVFIPQVGKIDSLSLSQAIAVFLYKIKNG